MKRGKLQITNELLIDVLHLPPGTEIVSAISDECGRVVLLVEHEDLQDVPQGGAVPFVNPAFTRHQAIPETVTFDGWGQVQPIATPNGQHDFKNSSNLKWARYDPEAMQLEIAFVGGGIYRYFGVPAADYEGLRTAESPGSFFATNVKSRRNEKILATPEAAG
jgi:hypothetical protein